MAALLVVAGATPGPQAFGEPAPGVRGEFSSASLDPSPLASREVVATEAAPSVTPKLGERQRLEVNPNLGIRQRFKWPPKSPSDLGGPWVGEALFREAGIWNVMKDRDTLDCDLTLLFTAADRPESAAEHSGLTAAQIRRLRVVMRKRWRDGVGFVAASAK
jgi:hypothetical protein